MNSTSSNDFHPSEKDDGSPMPHHETVRQHCRLRREQSVKQIVNPLHAQSNYSKWRHRLKRLASFKTTEETPHETPVHLTKQDERYRIRSIDHDTAWFDHTSEHLVIALLTNYFKWTFRSSFLKVILSACALYVLWIFLFAAVIYVVMKRIPECIGGTEDYFFVDAYHLSWTTLSTVGYGLIGPTVGLSSQRWYCTFHQPLLYIHIFLTHSPSLSVLESMSSWRTNHSLESSMQVS